MNTPNTNQFQFRYGDGERVYTAARKPGAGWHVTWDGSVGGAHYSFQQVELALGEGGMWKRIQPEVNVDSAIGTVLEFTVDCRKDEGRKAQYKMTKVGPTTWLCHGIDEARGNRSVDWESHEILQNLLQGVWTVDAVNYEEPAPLTVRGLAVKYGLTVQTYPNGLTWFSNGPLNYQIALDADFEEGLANVEKFFGTIHVF